jgi:hypothetical protein
MKVYAEHGAFRDELWRLQRQGLIELVTFPYESKNRKVRTQAVPSEARFSDLGHITIGEMNFPIGDMSGSTAYPQILEIVGSRNRRDALHIDSAYKSGCKAFLSRDTRHIIANGQRLAALLGIRFFHPDSDWSQFLTFVGGK